MNIQSVAVVALLGASAIFSACKDKGADPFSITGDITGAENKKIIVETMSFPADGRPNFTIVDTAWADSKGHFEIENYLPERMICRLSVDGDKMNYYIISLQNEDITMEATLLEPGNPKIVGSPATGSLFGLMDAIRDFDMYANGKNDTIMKLKSLGQDSIVDAILTQLQSEYLQIFKGYADTATHASNIILAMESLYETDLDYIKAYYEKVKKSADSSSIYVKEMGDKIKMRDDLAAQSFIGKPFIDIVQPDMQGNMRKVSDLKGKVVLIDFWASWCGPCRKENPNVVKVYNTYKSKGFTVFSVSLDTDKARWIDAVQKDKLIWENHVCALDASNNQAAADYHVASIPSSFLVDENGIIVAENLRGAALEAKVKELLAD